METFKTRFNLSGVPTDVTVQVLSTHTFACTLNLADFFDGGEREQIENGPDFTLVKSEQDGWQLTGKSKITISAHDLENLASAIEQDYLR